MQLKGMVMMEGFGALHRSARFPYVPNRPRDERTDVLSYPTDTSGHVSNNGRYPIRP